MRYSNFLFAILFIMTGCGTTGKVAIQDNWAQKYGILLDRQKELKAEYEKLKNENNKLKIENNANEIKYRNDLKSKSQKISIGGTDYFFVGEAYGSKDENGNWHGVINGEIVWGDSLEHYATTLIMTKDGRKLLNYKGLFNNRVIDLP
jgi:hypothetical protein